MADKIKIGISSCLLGNKVRYDGGHKRDPFITATLGRYLDFVPVCPEAETGLGIPREAMRLVGDPDRPRLMTVRTGIDQTERMARWAEIRLPELEQEDLCGFIFKSDSPSSGMERVKVYGETGIPEKKGVGIFARLFMEHFPLLPVEEEGRLQDPVLREHFIERLFVFKRWREMLKRRPGRGALVAFHARHKYLLLAHSPKHYQELGKWVARSKDVARPFWYSHYQERLSEALRRKATPKKQVNVLLHLLGYFKKELSADEKKEALEIIADYGKGTVPLIVAVTLINHYVRKYDQGYLADQYYLHPHPLELQLRNHV
ncbi:MAG: DUF523 and DUF1722 domain-containing protein [Deltaproteobacteria bacterium]|nr:DUF523 and DUF1722 domain-containing protein [Deltaproteobacteria bacterium]